MYIPSWIPSFSYMAKVSLSDNNSKISQYFYLLSKNISFLDEQLKHYCREPLEYGYKIVSVEFMQFEFIRHENYIFFKEDLARNLQFVYNMHIGSSIVEDTMPNARMQPQFGFTLDITLKKDDRLRYERVDVVSDSYDMINEIAAHHCRFLIIDQYRIVEIRLCNFKFFPHAYFLYYKE